MELPATHGTTILRAATRKMTSFMNINEQNFRGALCAPPVASVLRGFQKKKLPTPGQKVGGWVKRVFTKKVILRKF